MTRAAFGRSVCSRRPAPAVPVALAVALPAASGGTPGLACQWCRLSTREAVSFVGAKGANGLAQEDMIATSLAPLTAARGSAGGATPVSVAYLWAGEGALVSTCMQLAKLHDSCERRVPDHRTRRLYPRVAAPPVGIAQRRD